MRQLIAVVIALGAFCLAPSNTQAANKVRWTIGMSQCNLGEPWRVQMNADIKKAAEQNPKLQIIFKDAGNDTLKQRAQIEEFVAKGVDLIIVSPKEAAPLTKPISEAYKKGIPVVVLDRRVLGQDYTTFIGADNKKIGLAVGNWLKDKLKGKGKVVELKGLMTSTPGQDRHTGFRQGISDSDLKVVFEADMKWLGPNARKEMESALSTQNDIDVVYAHNDPGAYGAYLAAKAKGLEKKMLFVGIDGLPQEGKAYVEQGILAASFEYPTGGAEAVDAALKILDGVKVEKEITLKSHVYTPENVKAGGELL